MVTSEIMTRDPETADATATVGEVITKLHELDVRHLPILSDGELIGIVSDRDLQSFSVPELSRLMEGEFTERLATPISEVMEGDVISVNPETDVKELIDLMIEHKIGALPVVDEETRELAGIVSYIDLLRAVREEI